jgi:hypothetical protein
MDDTNFKSNIQDLPHELTQDIYKNGNETIIRTRHKDQPALPEMVGEEHDEKVEEVPILPQLCNLTV